MSASVLQGLPTLLVEDDQLIGEACAGYLRRLGLAVECAETYDQALQIVHERIASFRLVIADLSLRRDGEKRLHNPNALGLNIVRLVHQLAPEIPVVIWTAYPHLIANVLDLMLQGYRGLACVPKGNTVDVLEEAIFRVLDGGVVLEISAARSSSVEQLLLGALDPQTAQAVERLSNQMSTLTARQREVANLLVCTIDVIARRLSLSPRTVRHHRDDIYKKLGLMDSLWDNHRDILTVLAVLLHRLRHSDAADEVEP